MSKLKEYREKLKLSQSQMAKAIGDFAGMNLAQTTYGEWERGTDPRKKWRKVIADFTKGKVIL